MSKAPAAGIQATGAFSMPPARPGRRPPRLAPAPSSAPGPGAAATAAPVSGTAPAIATPWLPCQGVGEGLAGLGKGLAGLGRADIVRA